MICSSVHLDRFIGRPPSGGRTLLRSGGDSGAQVRDHQIDHECRETSSFAEGFDEIIEPIDVHVRINEGRNFLNLSSVERVRANSIRIVRTDPSDFFYLREGRYRNIIFNCQELSVSIVSGQPMSNPRLHGSTLRVGSGPAVRSLVLASNSPRCRPNRSYTSTVPC